ncbi:MAG: hypothetical protein C4348_02800 [Patescibacteria group bacterium]
MKQTGALGCSLLADSSGKIICTPSSLKYKENIQDLNFDVNKFLSLEPKTFEFKKSLDFNLPGKHVGFIAEEVSQVFPDLVRYNKNNEPEGIKYENLPVYLFKLIKDLLQNFESKVKNVLRNYGIDLDNLFVREINIEKVNINQANIKVLCLEGSDGEKICINKDQLKEILMKTNSAITTGNITGNQNSNSSTDTNTTTPDTNNQENSINEEMNTTTQTTENQSTQNYNQENSINDGTSN